MNQSKIMMQLLFISITIAVISIFGPYYLFSEFLLQAQFLMVFMALFAMLSFFAYTITMISNTFDSLSKDEDQNILPQFPNFSDGFSLRQLMSFGDNLTRFIRVRLLSQDKLIDDYNKTNLELKSHIEINRKFLRFAQQSISVQKDESIHVIIQNEILNIIGSFDASSFYILDNCGDLLRLDSSYGFEDDRFLLQSVPIADFFSPMHSEESTIKILEKVTYSSVQHFITDSARRDEVYDIIELPIYLDKYLYGIFYFYNTDPDREFSDELRLLLKSYTTQAINAVTNKILIKKTVFLSKYDSLTGLYNRSYFEQYFDDFNKHALRYKEHYSIVLIDLNRLKSINDKFGHVAGDRALQEFALTFKDKIRETDVFARFGGDEFILIFHNSNLEQTEKRLKVIHDEFAHHHIRYGSFNIPIRFSYGVASSPDESMILNILVKIADERMYQLKDKLHESEKEDFNF